MDSIKIYELYDNLWYKPFWSYYLFWILLGLLLSIFFIFLIRRLYKKKRVIVSPWDQALQDLERLKPEYFEGYERRKEFYREITRILKSYLSLRYNINLIDKTDHETLKDLQYVIGSSQILEKLENIMSGAVWAKFGPEDIIRQEMAEHLHESISIVKNTKKTKIEIS